MWYHFRQIVFFSFRIIYIGNFVIMSCLYSLKKVFSMKCEEKLKEFLGDFEYRSDIVDFLVCVRI